METAMLVIQVVIAIITLIIMFVELNKSEHEKRKNDLQKTIKELDVGRGEFTSLAMEIYKKHFGFEGNRYLVYRDDWINRKKSNGDFYLLSEIKPQLTNKEPICPTAGKKNKKFPDENDSYADNVKYYTNKKMVDLPLYGLADVLTDEKDTFGLNVKLGRYFDFYNTCEYRAYEMAYARRIKGKFRAYDLSDASVKTLPHRYGKDGCALNLFDTTNRFAGIGINAITILRNVTIDDQTGERDNFFLVHKRSDKVAEGTGRYHVIPAGSYQPLDANTGDAEPLEYTVLREFGEELLGYDEFINLGAHELLRELQNLQPIFLGIGFEPLNTKAEILAALVIDFETEDRNLFGGKRSLSELKEFFQAHKQYEGTVELCRLSKDMLQNYENDPRSTPSMKEILRIMREILKNGGMNSI